MIRPLRNDDYRGVVSLLRTVRADSIYTAAGMRHLIDSMPERAANAAWVADEGDGEIVGWSWAHRRWWRANDTAYAWVGVHPAARRRGLGGALWELAETHALNLGITALFTDVPGDPAGERFVHARGFEPGPIDRISSVDPRKVDLGELAERETRASADGYRLVTFRDADLHGLFRLSLETADDMPGGDAPHEVSFEEWRDELVDHPDLNQEASMIVVRDGEPVAHCLMAVDLDGRRARNEGTGTARDHRRRGLATLAKLAAIRWAVEHEIQTIITDNSEQNVGMLAINERLGFRPLITRQRWTKDVSGAEAAS